MPALKPENAAYLYPERDRSVDETSDEPFNRRAFALRALEIVRPPGTTVAICDGARLRVDSGRAWGRDPGRRWAVLAIPAHASRRAIALAVAELAHVPPPYALDVLLA